MPEEEENKLHMSFVVCESNGGPFDDRTFFAGCNFARHHISLLACPEASEWSDWVVPEMVPQYDLLAMDFGYVMTTETCEEDTDGCMVRVIFKKSTEILEE